MQFHPLPMSPYCKGSLQRQFLHAPICGFYIRGKYKVDPHKPHVYGFAPRGYQLRLPVFPHKYNLSFWSRIFASTINSTLSLIFKIISALGSPSILANFSVLYKTPPCHSQQYPQCIIHELPTYCLLLKNREFYHFSFFCTI